MTDPHQLSKRAQTDSRAAAARVIARHLHESSGTQAPRPLVEAAQDYKKLTSRLMYATKQAQFEHLSRDERRRAVQLDRMINRNSRQGRRALLGALIGGAAGAGLGAVVPAQAGERPWALAGLGGFGALAGAAGGSLTGDRGYRDAVERAALAGELTREDLILLGRWRRLQNQAVAMSGLARGGALGGAMGVAAMGLAGGANDDVLSHVTPRKRPLHPDFEAMLKDSSRDSTSDEEEEDSK